MKSLSIFLLGAGLFTLALCGCTSQPSQKETGMSDSIVKVQDNPVIETIMARRSIRKYKPEAVERDKMETILNCGIHAPNGMNKQSWEVRVVDNQDFINELTEISRKKIQRLLNVPDLRICSIMLLPLLLLPMIPGMICLK